MQSNKPDDPGGALLAAAVQFLAMPDDPELRLTLRRVVDETEGLPFMPAWRRLWHLTRLCATTFASGSTLEHLRAAIAATKGTRPFLHNRFQPPRRHARALERWQERRDLN